MVSRLRPLDVAQSPLPVWRSMRYLLCWLVEDQRRVRIVVRFVAKTLADKLHHSPGGKTVGLKVYHIVAVRTVNRD